MKNSQYFFQKSSVSEWEVIPKFIYSFPNNESLVCEELWFLIVSLPITGWVTCSLAYSPVS